MGERIVNENFLAKTAPKRKDIQWHTDDLLNNLRLLKELYPNLQVDWDMLRFACIYHDLGKMYKGFQDRIHGKGISVGIPHGFLSLGFIDIEYLENLGYGEKDIEVLFQAVAYHHERDIDFEMDDIVEGIRTLIEVFEKFEYEKLPSRNLNPEFDPAFFYLGKRVYESRDKIYFFKTIMLKGLLNRLDYAASAEIPVERPNDFLMESMEQLMSGWKKEDPKAEWKSLQKYMLKHQNENVVIIAQTGMGKTEAGLLWLGDNKGFFVLPLKSAINAIYKRIKNNIVTERIEDRVALLHSDTLKVYSEDATEKLKLTKRSLEEDMELETYYIKTRQLSLPLTICTLDQVFDFVFRYKGFEPKLATLSYSKIIIDEIQMYSPELVAYLILGLMHITKMGGRFAIMTATLPGVILDLMEKEGIKPGKPAVFTDDIIRHSIKKIEASIDDDNSIAEMAEAYRGNKLLIICNTIKKAKIVYDKLKDALKDESKVSIELLHSGFIRRDRNKKEDEIMKLGKRGGPGCGIWVTTQLVEASLDIDFDLLFTELSDLNGLFQRMGRCYRHRILDLEYNCFVYVGGVKKCSGVGTFIDEKIHDFSKEAISSNGPVDEETKIEMIRNTYSTEKLLGTKYHTSIKNTIRYIKSISSYDLKKKEVAKMFRDIDQVMVIPLRIFKENEEDIKGYMGVLKDKSIPFIQKNTVREHLRDFMVPAHIRLAEGTACLREKINRNDELIVVDAEYSYEEGISFEKTNNQEFRDVENRIF